MSEPINLYDDLLNPGAIAGLYVIDELAFQGGFANVYRARHVRDRSVVALKVLRQALARSMNHVRRFRREAATLRNLVHPHIVQLVGDGADELLDGRPFIALEWLPNGSLATLLRDRGAFTVGESVAILNQVGSALAFAHERGVVHRDLKAQNIFTRVDDDHLHCKLGDFGIAKMNARSSDLGTVTSHGILGTEGLMAPEQLLGRPVDARTDIYALGILMYHLLTGRIPFVDQRGDLPGHDRQGHGAREMDRILEAEEMHLSAPRPKPSLHSPAPRASDRIIALAMAVDPDDRYGSVREFLDAVNRHLSVSSLALGSERAVERSAPVRSVAVYAWFGPRDEDDPGAQAAALHALECLCVALEQLGLEIVMENADTCLATAHLTHTANGSLAQRSRVLDTVQAALVAAGENSQVQARAILRIGDAYRNADGDGLSSHLLRISEWPDIARWPGPSGSLLVDRQFARGLLAIEAAREPAVEFAVPAGYHYLSSHLSPHRSPPGAIP